MLLYVILVLVGFVAGVLCAGYVVAAIGGLKTEFAILKLRATNDVLDVHKRLDDLEAKIASKL